MKAKNKWASQWCIYSVSEASHLQLDPEWTAEKELCMRKGVPYTAPTQRVEDDEHMAEEASGIAEGSRCEVHPGAKRGAVRWEDKPSDHRQNNRVVHINPATLTG